MFEGKIKFKQEFSSYVGVRKKLFFQVRGNFFKVFEKIFLNYLIVNNWKNEN